MTKKPTASNIPFIPLAASERSDTPGVLVRSVHGNGLMSDITDDMIKQAVAFMGSADCFERQRHDDYCQRVLHECGFCKSSAPGLCLHCTNELNAQLEKLP